MPFYENYLMLSQELNDIGKKHALKKYDQFALNTSCFLGGSTGSNVTLVVQFHEFFVTKVIINN